jgi:hypothetical protein
VVGVYGVGGDDFAGIQVDDGDGCFVDEGEDAFTAVGGDRSPRSRFQRIEAALLIT